MDIERTHVVLIAAMLLNGCATMTHKSPTNLAVLTNVPAECVLSDKLGRRGFRAPGAVSAQPRHAPTVVSCSAEGYEPASVGVATSTNGAVWGNIILGGLIGYAIDAGSGNTRKFDGTANLYLRPRQGAPGPSTPVSAPTTSLWPGSTPQVEPDIERSMP